MGGGGATYAAHGQAFSYGNLIAFGRGGLTNGPELFGMSAGRTGLRGEAGTEAVLPLRRGSNGDLGVLNVGGGGQVRSAPVAVSYEPPQIQIINQTGSDMSATTSRDGENFVIQVVAKNYQNHGTLRKLMGPKR